MNPQIVSRGAIRACFLLLIIGALFYLGSCRKTDVAVEDPGKKEIPDWVMENIKKMP